MLVVLMLKNPPAANETLVTTKPFFPPSQERARSSARRTRAEAELGQEDEVGRGRSADVAAHVLGVGRAVALVAHHAHQHHHHHDEHEPLTRESHDARSACELEERRSSSGNDNSNSETSSSSDEEATTKTSSRCWLLWWWLWVLFFPALARESTVATSASCIWCARSRELIEIGQRDKERVTWGDGGWIVASRDKESGRERVRVLAH